MVTLPVTASTRLTWLELPVRIFSLNMKIYEEGINSLKKVTVKSGTYSHEEQLNINGMTGTLPNGKYSELQLHRHNP